MKERLIKLKLALVVEWGELAQRLGISRSMLDKVRTGERDPGPQLERAILEAERQAGLNVHHSPRGPDEIKRLLKEPSSAYGLPAVIDKELLDDVYRLEKLAHEFTEGLVKIRAKLEQYGKKKERDL